MKSCIAYIDGGSRGNPGLAGCGIHLVDEHGKTLASLSKALGIRTNNFAEYSALIAALEYAEGHQYEKVKIYADSELLVRQINGVYGVKNPGLKRLYNQAQSLISRLQSFSIQHIPREKNHEADRLANLAMDKGEVDTEVKKEFSAFPMRVQAVFRDGSFKPLEPVNLPENTKLYLKVEADEDGNEN